jgi:hypothetical protein
LSARRIILTGTAGVVAVLAVVLALLRWDSANKIAVVVSALAAVAAVGVAIWAALPAMSPRQGLRVSRTGGAVAGLGSPANPEVSGTEDSLPGDLPIERTGDAEASGGRDASTGIRPPPPDGPIRRRPPPLPPLVPGTSFVGNVPALPSRFVARADIFDTLRDQIVSHATVALVGMGGAGKTILAAAVAHDAAVQATFRDGIVWVDAGQQNTPTQLQERLVTRLSGEMASFPTTEVGRHRLAELLAGRAFLLVVDDVWDAEVLNALNVVGEPQGALLFTTRDRGVARAVGTVVQDVDVLELEQARALLGRWTETELDRLPPVADALCLRAGNLALAVALVGGMVKSRGAHAQDWLDVTRLLETADVDAIADAYGPDSYRHRSVLASIAVSIDDLLPADRVRYRELAVFAGRAHVPPVAVSALWASAGSSADDTGRLLAGLPTGPWLSATTAGGSRSTTSNTTLPPTSSALAGSRSPTAGSSTATAPSPPTG